MKAESRIISSRNRIDSTFIHDDFLLQSETARRLYHENAADLPIIDFHNHLSPREIAEDRRFENIAQIWLAHDHYKWRAMRAAGVEERFITGSATDREKFDAWATTVPQLGGNPQFHWTQMELKRYFDIDDVLCPDTAERIWGVTQEKLAGPEYSTRLLLDRSGAVLLCTTDDPCDSLEFHRAIRADDAWSIQVLPTWRPDMALAVDRPDAFNGWLGQLEELAGRNIESVDELLQALRERQAVFHDHGCRAADHGIEQFYGADYTGSEVDEAFRNVRRGNAVSRNAAVKFKSCMLVELARMNHERGWAQQFHVGALRNANGLRYKTLGPDAGFDSIGDCPVAEPMAAFFDRLEREDALTRTIVYNNNPKDSAVVATMLGSFQDGIVAGKMQLGAAWWHLDHKPGIEQHLEIVANTMVLRRFVGMVTDSRSILSFVRHEYFRRILCNWLGNQVELGLLPNDSELLGNTVGDICYENARVYFDFDLPIAP